MFCSRPTTRPGRSSLPAAATTHPPSRSPACS